MTPSVTQYKKELKKQLRCCGSAKTRLLEKFDVSASSFLEESPSPDREQLCAAFGPPKDMATLLMSEITPEEASRYRRTTWTKRVIAGILAVLFLSFTVYIYFIKQKPLVESNEVIIDAVVENSDETADPLDNVGP